jgi:hypothetical protein
MTIWTDLQTAIDAKIAALGYTGTLANLGIDQPFSPTLANLLNLQAQLSEIIGSGGGSSSIPSFTNSPTNFGAANQAVLKASASAVYKIYCYNKNASTRFFQIHNKATAPVNTDVPIESFPVAANSALIIDSTFFGSGGRTCSAGISWAFSSTEATLTLATAGDQTSSVGYL